jgi:hypothetical protein
LDEKQLKNANVESLIFVILGSFQNCTFLKNWSETLHSFTVKILWQVEVMHMSHVEKNCQKEFKMREKWMVKGGHPTCTK